MAEKIVYEVGLDGVSAVVGNINTIQNALDDLHIPALNKQIGSIYDELSKIPHGISLSLVHVERELAEALKKESKYVERLTREYEVLNVLRAKNIDVGGVGNSPTDRPNLFTTSKIFAANNSRTTWDHKYATYGVGPDGEFGATPVANGVLSHFAAEFQRAKNKASGDWGTIKQRARAFTESIFGKTVPLLTYDWRPGDKIYGAGNAFTTGVSNPNMDSPYYGQSPTRGANTKVIKEFKDAYYRKYKKWYAPTVWRGGAPAIVNPTGTALATLNNKYGTAGTTAIVKSTGTALATLNNKYGIVDTGRVTDPGYVDAEWSYVGAGSMSGARATALPGGSPKQLGYSGGALAKHVGNMIPPPSMLSRLMGLLGKLNTFATVVQAAVRGLKFVYNAIKRFVNGLVALGKKMAEASWRQLRESYAHGTSISSLARAERGMIGLGGDAASASALWGRWANERSMLAFGGNGGSMMEAARLFGIGIMGSGEHGFATQDEFTRNVIDAMTNATPERRNAIAGTLGLTPYQTWAFSHGQGYYDMLTRRSLTHQLGGERFEEWDRKNSGENAKRFHEAWGNLMNRGSELLTTISDAVLPGLTKLLDLLSLWMECANLFLKIPTKIFSLIDNLTNLRWWYDLVTGTPTKEENAMQMQAITNNGQNLVINVGDITMPSLPNGISSKDAADRYAREIFNRLGEQAINNRR